MAPLKVVFLTEETTTDPDEMESPDDLPKNIEDALPDGGEEMFWKELKKAKKENPDGAEQEWYAQAWEKVNDHYEKGYDDAGDSWEKKEESRDIGSKIDSFLEDTKEYEN